MCEVAYLFFSYFIIIGLGQFREDSREQRCPVDMLLVLGANDLIRSGPSSLSEGLREWKITLQTYSHERCHVYGSTLAASTLAVYVFVVFANLNMCFITETQDWRVFLEVLYQGQTL